MEPQRQEKPQQCGNLGNLPDPLIDRFAIRPGIPASMLDNPILT
jgi:hypothetical protein